VCSPAALGAIGSRVARINRQRPPALVLSPTGDVTAVARVERPRDNTVWSAMASVGEIASGGVR